MSEESISFSKKIAKSNISKPFQLCFPKEFCDEHLACHDNAVILVDEKEREYSVMYLTSQYKLGRGWRDFVTAHGLLEGDILSFHLIDRYKFKVHIIRGRASRFAENEFQNNVSASLGKREVLTEENTCFGIGNTVAKKYLVSCVEMQDRMLSQIKKRVHKEVVSKEKVYIKSPHRSTETNCADGYPYLDLHNCSNDDEHTRIVKRVLPAMDVHATQLLESDCNSTPLASIKNSELNFRFKGFEDFKISVNGEILDSEIPLDIRMKYYQLCCGQKKFIHDRAMLVQEEHMQDRMLSQFKKRVHDEDVVSKEKVSTGTDGTIGSSYVNFPDCPNDDEHTRIVEKELPAVDVYDKTSLESGYDSTPPKDHQSVSVEHLESVLSLKDFEDFKIHVNGETLDSEIPQDVRMKYYQLCCGQNKLIHDRVMMGLNSKFAIAVVQEIVRTADSTKAATISTSPHDLECMGKMLQFFEDLGFAVGSLHAKISTLTKISNEQQTLEGQSVSVEYSQSALSFKNFEDFKIEVNGGTLDSEIPPDVRMKYYQLCCDQKKFIHDRVVKGINSDFAVSVIIEIVRIVDSTKAVTISTAPHVLECMGKILKSFEDLGFAVGTLRAKVGTLTIFSSEHRQTIEETMRLMSEIESERTTFQEKKTRIAGLTGSSMAQNGELVGNLCLKIDALKEKSKRLELVFKKVAELTW